MHTQAKPEGQTANQRNTSNLKFPGRFWLQSEQFLAMPSHRGILYEQTQKYLYIITYLYINVSAKNVT